jgi:hypothetical protein
MTDRYTELVRTAYEAQQAREGDGYVKLTTELAVIDNQLEALAASRETTVAALEAMDEAVEAAKEALDAYFAGREENGFFGDEKPFGYMGIPEQAAVYEPADEFSTPRANGAYSDDLQDFTPPARAD